MRRKRATRRPPALERCDRLGGHFARRQLTLGGRGLEFLQLELHLVQEARFAFRAAAVELAPQLLDRELQMGDEGCGAGQIRLSMGGLGPGLCELGLGRDAGRALRDDHRVGARKIGRKWFGSSGHGPMESHPPWPASRIVIQPRVDAKLPGDDASRCRTKDS